VREPQHLVLVRPPDGRIEQAGNADPVRQPTFDGGFDETWREEGERDRHIDVALAAGLAIGNVVDRRGAGLDLGQPPPAPRNRGDELGPGVSPNWTNFS
jgi:hypothetical protein